MADARRRAAAVYCRGPLLDAVQRARIFGDGKHFVDMPLKVDPEEALSAFEALPAEAKSDPERLRAFVAAHFDEPGAELEPYEPEGFPEEPPLIKSGHLTDPGLKRFTAGLHGLWRTLCRVTATSVSAAPQRTSALPRKYPMVLPGGRFRETYYWDSLWIVQGLLASGLRGVAQGLVQNLLDDVGEFGFVPNGGRIYYLNRSQPPLLHAMVTEVAERMDAEEESKWLPGAFSALKSEYNWWMSEEHGHVVTVGGFTLNRFHANWDEPRPESYWEDYQTASGSASTYRELASVAETGWDFSSRWSRTGGRAAGVAGGTGGGFPLNSSEATRVVPVDLNAMMYSFEVTLAAMSQALASGKRLGDVLRSDGSGAGGAEEPAEARGFRDAAARRRAAFDGLFWRQELGRWVDVWLPPAQDGAAAAAGEDPAEEQRRRSPTLADFSAPLWAHLGSAAQAEASLAALRSSGLLGPAGASTTAIASGEQWDAPNAWPPLQEMLIEGLRTSGAPGAEEEACELAKRWVGTCFAAWEKTGFMHEKYSATNFGHGGAGGEYESQVGFGWSNGVVLRLLERYGDRLAPRPEATC